MLRFRPLVCTSLHHEKGAAMTWLVVGLGNPGPQYASTRHNIGFMTIAELAARAGERLKAAKGMHAETASTRLGEAGLGIPGGEPLILATPRTFMNESGRAVRPLADFHRIQPDHIIVVHDELDLEPGRMRIKLGGGDNGHNGLKSIRAHLGTGDFYRVRLGIGRPMGHQAGADYVLARFGKSEREEIAIELADGADAVISLINEGLAPTQNRFNS